jgi:hypothetical protein
MNVVVTEETEPTVLTVTTEMEEETKTDNKKPLDEKKPSSTAVGGD